MNAARTGIDLLDELSHRGHEVGLGAPLSDEHRALYAMGAP
jgi:hypothetical protein